jgi:hypothetical protein
MFVTASTIERVIHAIDAAFSPAGIDDFLSSLQLRGAHVASIREVSSNRTPWISRGPSPTGQTFMSSFWEAYNTLTDAERGSVDVHYQSRVASIPEELRQKYPRPFV